MYTVKNNIIYLNLQRGGANMHDPSANMYDPSGNANIFHFQRGGMNDPSANMHDPSANMYDPSANMNDPSNNYYRIKYIKYKLKYIKLRQQLGGNTIDEDIATYTVLGNDDGLRKLVKIKESSDVDIIRSLTDDDDSLIAEHARIKLFELGVAPPVVAPPVVAQPAYNPSRNPGINRAPPTMPDTQSPFYMPLISEAYYLARGLQVPQSILDAGCGVINLNSGISQVIYNRMVTALVDHLRQNDNIGLLTIEYNRDAPPTDHSAGHIDGPAQVELLERPIFEGLPLVIKLETAIQTHYGR